MNVFALRNKKTEKEVPAFQNVGGLQAFVINDKKIKFHPNYTGELLRKDFGF